MNKAVDCFTKTRQAEIEHKNCNSEFYENAKKYMKRK